MLDYDDNGFPIQICSQCAWYQKITAETGPECLFYDRYDQCLSDKLDDEQEDSDL